MDTVIKISQLLLSLSILVFIHEFGHFFFAKLFHTRVDKFYLFFPVGFSLFKFKKGDTEYGVGWLPIGGFVKIAGMVDESMDTKQLQQAPQSWEFRSKPAWQRLLMMAGGVLMNVLLAFVVYMAILYTWGETYLPVENVRNGVTVDSVFNRIGLENGDKIIALDGKKIDDFFAIMPDMLLNSPKSMEIKRDGKHLSLMIPSDFKAELLRISSNSGSSSKMFIMPRLLLDSMYVGAFADYSVAYDAGIRKDDRILSLNGIKPKYYDMFTGMLDTLADKPVTTTVLRGKDTLTFNFALESDGKFGIVFSSTEKQEFAVKHFTFLQSIPAGFHKGLTSITSYLKQFKLLFTPKSEAYKSLGGVISMGNIFPGVWNWEMFWELTALLSIMLAVVNILPIPALDGGHILFLLVELITRRKPSQEFLMKAQMIGLFIILGLFFWTTINDITRFF
jgi:regulator of sigma E protease